MVSQRTHTKEEILSLMEDVPVVVVATAAGEVIRTRMMHYASDSDFNIYLATMKGDPKTIQLTHHPSISLLVHQSGANITESREVEITGKAVFVRDEQERAHALEMTAKRSPVVKYLMDSGNGGLLDCLKVVPSTVKLRIFSEITQGMPPTVIEFPQNRAVVSEWHLLSMKLQNWRLAIRAPFLTASIVPVLLGTAIAWFTSRSINWGLFLLTLLAGVLIHMGANVINDYFDYKSGNDDVNREFVRPFSGGSRAIQLGLLSPLEVLGGALLFFLVSALIGFYLAWTRGPFILLLGVIGLLSSMFYTGRPFYWAKRGIGELVVGLNFGILMTLGTFYVQTQSISWLPVIAAIPVGLLIAAVLYINEFQDYTADKQVGKNNLVVRLGRKRAAVLYVVLMAAVYLSIAAGVATGVLPAISLLGLSTMPLAIRAVQYASRHYDSSFDLVPANALTVITHLATGLLLTLAFISMVLGTNGLVWEVMLGIILLGVVVWMYRHIERQKNAFLNLKQVVK